MQIEQALEWLAANGGAIASMQGARLEVTIQVPWRGQPVLYRERVGARGPERWTDALCRVVARVSEELAEADREEVEHVNASLGHPGPTNRERLDAGPNMAAGASRALYTRPSRARFGA